MHFTSFDSPNLCFVQKSIGERDAQKVCEIAVNEMTALVLCLIGIAFIVTGLYLALSGIGTIPSISLSASLFVAGGGLFAMGIFLRFRPQAK